MDKWIKALTDASNSTDGLGSVMEDDDDPSIMPGGTERKRAPLPNLKDSKTGLIVKGEVEVRSALILGP